MTDLTSTDVEFEIVEATRTETIAGEEVTQDWDHKANLNRWSSDEHDRLYINEITSSSDVYIDLQTGEVETDLSRFDYDVERNGNEWTISVSHSKDYTVVVRAITDDNDESDDQQPVTDGGEGATDHVDEDTIETAIEEQDGPLDDERTATVAEVRDALAWLQQSVKEHWSGWCDNIEHDESRVVYEDNEVIVCSTGEQNVPHRDLREHYPDKLDERVPDIVSSIHHELARDRCDYDWGYEYPIVIRKAGALRDGQRYVEAVMNSLLRRGLTPGQAWAYYGAEIRGNSNNSWASRCGYSDHSAVSEPLRKAKQKL